MASFHKDFNSKGFLFTYLVIVGVLLVILISRLPSLQPERREIPKDMQTFLASPIRQLPSFELIDNNKQVLTNDYFIGKWSIVYFSFSHCLPLCQPSLTVMKNMQTAFGDKDINFLLIGIDDQETSIQLNNAIEARGYNFDVASGASPMIEELANAFETLYLKTTFDDGRYQIEQEHHIFLVDPKGRLYATFKPPFESADIQSKFLKSHFFYAKTE